MRREADLRADGPAPRLDSLTGARFVAAFGVFLYHASLAFPAEGAFGRALAVVGRNGAIGVDFFFALSGFVLAWSWRPGGSARAFYRRRFARLAPAYWVALLYGLVWVMVLYRDPVTASVNAVPAVLGVQAWFPDPAVHYAANNPAWSVSAEVFFYAVFPLLALAASNRAGRRALGAGAVVLGLVVPQVLRMVTPGDTGSWLINTLPAVRIGEFICGLVLATALRRGLRVPVGPRTACVLLAACYFTVPLAPGWFPHQSVLLVVLLVVIAALAQSDLRGGTVLARRLPVGLGEWSYCFYLVHLMTTQIVLLLCARFLPAPLLGPVWLIAALAASLLLAGLLHRLVERPFERRIRGSLARPAASSLATAEEHRRASLRLERVSAGGVATSAGRRGGRPPRPAP